MGTESQDTVVDPAVHGGFSGWEAVVGGWKSVQGALPDCRAAKVSGTHLNLHAPLCCSYIHLPYISMGMWIGRPHPGGLGASGPAVARLSHLTSCGTPPLRAPALLAFITFVMHTLSQTLPPAGAVEAWGREEAPEAMGPLLCTQLSFQNKTKEALLIKTERGGGGN